MTESPALSGTAMDDLDHLANDAYSGRVVRKDLVRQVKVGANVPVYVLEFLLGRSRVVADVAEGHVALEPHPQELFARQPVQRFGELGDQRNQPPCGAVVAVLHVH